MVNQWACNISIDLLTRFGSHYSLSPNLKASPTTSVVDPAEIPDSGNVADAFGLSGVMRMPTASGYEKDIGF